MNWRPLLASLDPKEAVKHSMLNHHAIGFHYLNLFRSDRLTVKLYLAPEKPAGCGDGSLLVSPHTHRYSFDTYIVTGSVCNVLFHEEGDTPYTRRVCVPGRAELPVPTVLKAGRYTWHQPGDHYSMTTRDIHSIILDDGPTVMVLAQYHDEFPTSMLYSPGDSKPSFEGLYTKPTTDDVRWMIDTVRRLTV